MNYRVWNVRRFMKENEVAILADGSLLFLGNEADSGYVKMGFLDVKVEYSTGLKYNGEEVYKGDIISILCDCDSEFGCSHRDEIHEVVWNDNAAGFELKNKSNGRLYHFDEFGEENMYKIGNIHEDAELLK